MGFIEEGRQPSQGTGDGEILAIGARIAAAELTVDRLLVRNVIEPNDLGLKMEERHAEIMETLARLENGRKTDILERLARLESKMHVA